MAAYLVTGNPGSGKSALARELAGRGLLAIDPDDDPELAHWQDEVAAQPAPATAPERAQPILPLRPGIPGRQSHDYVRHGVTSLFAALNTATGQVTDACYPRHRHQEFLRFLKKVAAAYPGTGLHVVCDNYATNKHADVFAWLAKNRRITLHFSRPDVPGSISWSASSQSLPATPSAATPSPQSKSSPAPSARSSTAGTTTPGPSPGPRTPTRSSPASTAPRLKQASLQSPRLDIWPLTAYEAPVAGGGRLHMTVDSLLNDYGVAYSTNAVTWGRTPAGGCNSTDAAWSSACKK
jgi:DDE superfamily endonuclease